MYNPSSDCNFSADPIRVLELIGLFFLNLEGKPIMMFGVDDYKNLSKHGKNNDKYREA